MYYELYIDVFFLENFLMDSLILLAVNYALKCRASLGRIFMGGALGSALTCLTVVIPLPSFVKMILFYFVVSSAMLAAGPGIHGRIRFVKSFSLLYIMAVILGGVMYLFRPWMRYISVFFAVAGIGYLILTKLWDLLGMFRACRERTVEVTLYPGRGECVTASALLDTGNDLRDFATGSPVSILDPHLAEKISAVPETEKGFHLIPYHCVGGDSVMKVFRIEKMCIHIPEDSGGDFWIRDPVLGIGETELSGGGEYEMILHPGVLY